MAGNVIPVPLPAPGPARSASVAVPADFAAQASADDQDEALLLHFRRMGVQFLTAYRMNEEALENQASHDQAASQDNAVDQNPNPVLGANSGARQVPNPNSTVELNSEQNGARNGQPDGGDGDEDDDEADDQDAVLAAGLQKITDSINNARAEEEGAEVAGPAEGDANAAAEGAGVLVFDTEPVAVAIARRYTIPMGLLPAVCEASLRKFSTFLENVVLGKYLKVLLLGGLLLTPLLRVVPERSVAAVMYVEGSYYLTLAVLFLFIIPLESCRLVLRSTATQLYLVSTAGSASLAALLYSPSTAFDVIGTVVVISTFPLADGLQPKSRVKFQRWAYMLVGVYSIYSAYGMLRVQEKEDESADEEQSVTFKPPGFERPVSLVAIRAACVFNIGAILVQACVYAWVWPEHLTFTVGDAVGVLSSIQIRI